MDQGLSSCKQEVTVQNSQINGRGVFAKRDFGPNERILDWSGGLVNVVYINHSCSPSCYTIQPYRDGFAQDILMAGPQGVRRGEEVTFDYSKTRWRKLWRRTIRDNCGCGHCPKRRAKSS